MYICCNLDTMLYWNLVDKEKRSMKKEEKKEAKEKEKLSKMIQCKKDKIA